MNASHCQESTGRRGFRARKGFPLVDLFVIWSHTVRHREPEVESTTAATAVLHQCLSGGKRNRKRQGWVENPLIHVQKNISLSFTSWESYFRLNLHDCGRSPLTASLPETAAPARLLATGEPEWKCFTAACVTQTPSFNWMRTQPWEKLSENISAVLNTNVLTSMFNGKNKVFSTLSQS